MKILHMSDSHYEMRTMWALNSLARKRGDCAVVAVTGDVVSKNNRTLPATWNDWPQQLKLALPGNHGDHSSAFAHLSHWRTSVPWLGRYDDFVFVTAGISVGTIPSDFWNEVTAQCKVAGTKAIVVAVHCRPRGAALDLVRRVRGANPLLILHGDEHPKGFSGTEWDDSVPSEYRSHVCSSAPYRSDGTADKGVAHVIEFGSDGVFRAETVHGWVAA